MFKKDAGLRLDDLVHHIYIQTETSFEQINGYFTNVFSSFSTKAQR